jgi:hypothetical protein
METKGTCASSYARVLVEKLLRPITIFFLVVLTLAFSTVTPMKACAGQAVLAWDAGTSPDTLGYKLYWGSTPGNYTENLDVGNVTSYTVNSLIDGGKYYFVAKAYDSTGQLSDNSNEVNKTISSIIPTNYAVTATASGNGTIQALNNTNIATSASGSSIVTTVTVTSGASQTFSITPDSGYHVASVTVDGVSVGTVTTYTFSNVTAVHSLSATFALDAVGSYTISATAGSNGAITPSGSTIVSLGKNQSYTITPNGGYYVESVVVDGVTVASNIPSGGYSYTFSNVNANHTISATFAVRYFHVTASANTGGSISPADVWSLYNASQTITITPDSGYSISDVTVDGASVGAVSSYTLSNISADHIISAMFTSNIVSSYTISASAGSNGTISPTGSTSVSSGASKSFTITPNSGYSISNVVVDGISVGAVSTYIFSNVTANHTISATFAAVPLSIYSISASAGRGGSISPSGTVSVTGGASKSFTITPDRRYKVSKVLIDGVSVGAVTSYSFSNVRSQHTIQASFSR